MKTAIFAFSRQGCFTAERIMKYLIGGENRKFVPERFATAGFCQIAKPTEPFYGEQFQWANALIFVGACGIAVRAIAPHIRSKTTDPAVLCIDEQGKFVIPLLSGHIGGANKLALELAEELNAQAVITTATDINCRFSVDSWAVQNDFMIGNMTIAKEISAAILEHDIPLSSSLPIVSDLPDGMFLSDAGEIGIYIGWQKFNPFHKTLNLIPKILHLGIGCRKGIDCDTIRETIAEVFEREKIDKRSIKCISSIDLKANEEGLLEFSQRENLPIIFYSAEELNAVPGSFSGSDFVKKIAGVDNVCERAAMIGAEKLVLKKTALNSITVAIAAERKEVSFG